MKILVNDNDEMKGEKKTFWFNKLKFLEFNSCVEGSHSCEVRPFVQIVCRDRSYCIKVD